jgi:glycosyltransferase involved in cell wall biosynthesis
LRIVHAVNQLGIGGTEKTACLLARWAQKKGNEVTLLSMRDGPRADWARVLLNPENVVIAEEHGAKFEDGVDILHFHVGGPNSGLREDRSMKIVESQIFGHVSPQLPDLTIFVSPEIAARASEQNPGLPFPKFAVLRNPVRMCDGALLHARLDGIDSGTTVVGSIGRPDNAIFDPTHLKALATYIARHPERRMLYVRLGASPFEAEHLRALSIPHKLYPATCSDGEISRFLNTLDLYLHSRLDGECDSVSLAEAMAHGVRVLSHAVGVYKGHVEALAAFADLCECVPAQDEAAYLDGLERMIGDEDRARTAKKVLPRRVKERQGIEVIGNRLLKMYEKLLA